MDVHRAARISQKLQKTPHGHHVHGLVVVVAVVVVVVKRSRRKPQKVAVEEEGVDVVAPLVSSWIEESSVSVMSVSEEEVER